MVGEKDRQIVCMLFSTTDGSFITFMDTSCPVDWTDRLVFIWAMRTKEILCCLFYPQNLIVEAPVLLQVLIK